MHFSFLPYWKPQEEGTTIQRRITRETYILIVCIFGSLAGAVQGFLSTLSGMMLSNEQFLNDLSGEDNFTSRFIVLFYAGEIIGALLSFPLSDTFGRKTTLIYVSILCILTLIWNTVTSAGPDMLTARFFVGWTVGILMSIAPVYLSEIAPTPDRGKCCSFIALSSVIGSLLAGISYYLLNRYSFGWRICYSIPFLLLVCKCIGLSLLPESPRWLLARKTPAECLISMRQLRRTNDVSKEFNDIYLALSSDARLGEAWADILTSRSLNYRLMVSCVIQLCQEMVGIQVITTFGSTILSLLEMHSVILGLSLAYVAALMGTSLGYTKIDIWGRRFLMLSGSVAMFVSWIGSAVCVYSGGLEEGKAELYFPSYVMRFFFGSFLCLFAFFYSFSLGPISWVVPAEIFPLRARGKASALTTAAHGASAVLGAWLLNMWLASGYDAAACMLAFAGLVILLGIFVLLTLPETNGVMLEDMEELFAIEDGVFCCCPDLRYPMGFRILTKSKAPRSQHPNEQDAEKGNSGTLFEPSTLHKYSGGMRETKFEYFHDEDEPLVLTSTPRTANSLIPQSNKDNKESNRI